MVKLEKVHMYLARFSTVATFEDRTQWYEDVYGIRNALLCDVGSRPGRSIMARFPGGCVSATIARDPALVALPRLLGLDRPNRSGQVRDRESHKFTQADNARA